MALDQISIRLLCYIHIYTSILHDISNFDSIWPQMWNRTEDDTAMATAQNNNWRMTTTTTTTIITITAWARAKMKRNGILWWFFSICFRKHSATWTRVVVMRAPQSNWQQSMKLCNYIIDCLQSHAITIDTKCNIQNAEMLCFYWMGRMWESIFRKYADVFFR